MARTLDAAVSAPAPASVPLAAAGPDRAALDAVLAALGGRGNITGLHANSTRLCVAVRDPGAVDEAALAAGARDCAPDADQTCISSWGPGREAAAQALRAL